MSVLRFSVRGIPNFETILLNILQTGAFEMTLTKIHTKAAIITAAILAIAAATTATSFPNVTTVYATIQTPGATTDTTTPPGAAEGGGQQQAIHITKAGTNSYVLHGGSSQVGSFDTTYRVVGERSAIRSAENLIISTITEDFRNSPTIGYVRAGGTGTAGTGATLPNPFASHEQITERITTELRRVISEAESSTTPQGQHVEIKCDFGMSLEEMRCHHVPSAGAAGGAGALATEAPITPTNDTGTTTDTTAPILP
jgi:hypothetical protein